ncbi:MAG: zinc-binding dehydrogenase [Steroidobacteraceae bacterium]
MPAYGAAQYALYGEVALAPARSLVAVPEGVGFNEAAATWAAYGTAWGGLVSVGSLQVGQTILISARIEQCGSCGDPDRQSTRCPSGGTHPYRRKAAELRRLGASAVIATGEQDVVAEAKGLTAGKGADLVFDPVGGPEFATLARATTAGGILVLYGALDMRPTTVPPFEVFARDLTIRGLALAALTRNDAKLAQLKRFISEGLAEGAFHPTISRIFPFDQIADAHRFMEAGEQVGKILITL